MSKKITCTRCLGKGYVDNKDLKRLKRKSVWDENSECKFCKGKGTITENFASKHNPNSEKFPNVNDNSGLITNEEVNKQYREFKEKFGDKILNPDEEENNELENNSQPKTIFWTALITIILTLSVVLYYNKEFNEGSEISTFFKVVSFVIMLLFVPATIIYRLMFGKIDKEVAQAFHLYYPIAFFLFGIFLVLTAETIKFIKLEVLTIGESKVLLIITSAIISIIITKWFLKLMFFTKFKQDN